MDNEEKGSVEVDDSGSPTASKESSKEETNEKTGESQETGDQETDSGEEENQEEENQETGSKKSEEGKAKTTEKGTKLDQNPLSAAHQQLANERKKSQGYERVLNSPELLKKFAKESGYTLKEAKAEIKEELKYSADQFKNSGDIANTLNEMKSSFTKEITTLRDENKRLRGDLTGLSSSQKVTQVANTMKSDISAVQAKYPALNPKSSEFDPDLEKEIGSLYHELDYNPKSGGYRGKVSLAKLTDRVMKAAGKAGKKASDKAKTNVIVKKSGKVVTSSKVTSNKGSVSKDPATNIAQRINKTLKGTK